MSNGLVVAALGTASEAARILVFVPTPSISHQVVFRPIVQELANRGHDVVLVTTDPQFPKGKAPNNLTEIDMHDFSYKLWNENFIPTTSSNDNDLLTQVKAGIEMINNIFYGQVQTPIMQEIIRDKSKPFDLLLAEALARPVLALTHVLKVPAIQVSSLGAVYHNYEAIGAPVHPMLYPNFIRQKLYNLTFWDKVNELYLHYKFVHFLSSSEAEEDQRIKQIFGPDVPNLSELVNNVHMLFLNIHPIWEGNHPVPPGVIYMGGLHQAPSKELPLDLRTHLDSSVNGVIYMSFGTNVKPSNLPREVIEIFINVFAKLPYDVIWKWDSDVLLGKPDNVKMFEWLPQADLLRHPKMKLFITQGGLQSTDESITAGVPLIGIPMLGDQWYNVEKYTYHGIGLRLDIKTVTEKQLHDAIITVIKDKSYPKNVRRLRTLMNDQPMKSLDRVIWWTEYLLRHGGAKHLRSPAANISWAEYLEMEFVATLSLLVLTTAFFTSLTLYYLIRFVRSHRNLAGLKVKGS